MKNRQSIQNRYVESIVNCMSTKEMAEYVHYMMMVELDAMTDEELTEEIRFTGEDQLLEEANG
jgi:hypothetical protein